MNSATQQVRAGVRPSGRQRAAGGGDKLVIDKEPGLLEACVAAASSFFTVLDYHSRLTEPSVGSVGDSYDNALAETVIGLFKTEVIRRRGPWRSLEAVEYATLEWVDWYSNRRLLEPIGNVPPAEAEARYYAQLGPAAMAA